MKHLHFGLAAFFAASLGAASAQAATLLILNKEDATLSIVDPASGKTGATIPTGNGPHEVEVSGDGRLAFVSNYGDRSAPGHTLSVIDIAANKEAKRVDLGDLGRPHGLAFSKGQLYFTSEASRKVGRYDPVAGQVDWKFETGQESTHMVLTARDGKKLFTSNIGSNNISIIERDAAGTWTQTLVGVGKGPEGLDESPDGRELWSAHSQDGGVSIIDVASKKVTHTFDAQTKRSNRLKFTRDGKLVLITDLTSGELVIIDAGTRKQRKRLPLGSMPEGILIGPDGLSAFVAVAGEGHVAVIDLKTLSVTRKIAAGKGPDGMAWAP
ncbi:MAG: cytochrome D1 domain-containing protein [Steroidobacteraceae bacterium]